MCSVTSVDVDECLSSDACEASHVCINTDGSYGCECPTGFVADCGLHNSINPVCIGKKHSSMQNYEASNTAFSVTKYGGRVNCSNLVLKNWVQKSLKNNI